MLSLGRVSNIGSILRFPSKSRKSKDGGSNAKRHRAQTYDTVNEYRGGQSQKEAGSRKESDYGGPETASPASPAQGGVDNDSNNSSTTSGEADSRQPLRETSTNLRGQPLDPRQLEKRQAEEKDFIRQHDSSEAGVWYLIDVSWLQAWKCFVTRGGQMPGPIDNSRLVDRQTGKPKQGLAAVSDYRGVNEEIWNFWLRRYGGGPTIRRSQLDLYTQEVEDPAVSQQQQQQQQPQQQQQQQQGGSTLQKDVPLPGAPPPASGASGGRRPQGSSGAGEAAQQSSSRRSGGMFSTLGSRASSTTASSARSQQQSSPQGSSGSATSTTASSGRGGGNDARRSGQSDNSARQASSVPVPPEPVKAKLCCDKCDGPHETDKCPHFRKAREKHQDAWTSYGKTKKQQDADGDGAPIIRNARVISQPADGSCLFHSLSYGLSNGSSAASLRRDICGYIAKNPDMTIADTAIEEWIRYDSNDTVSQYAQRMAGGTWGGGIEMVVLTRMKGVNVHVYEKCREGYRRISAFESKGARKTVSVLYQGRMHYDAIVL